MASSFLKMMMIAPLASAGSMIAANYMLPNQMKPENLSKVFAVAQYRKLHPGASQAELKKIYEQTDGGMDGLLKMMTQQNLSKTKQNEMLGFEDDLGSRVAEPEKPSIPVDHDKGQIDQSKIDYIKNLMLPAHIKQAMMDNYLQTGVMLDIPSQAPAQQPSQPSIQSPSEKSKMIELDYSKKM